MKAFEILVISVNSRQLQYKLVRTIPQIGSSIDIFCRPLPKVTGVVMYPSSDTVVEFDAGYNSNIHHCEAIVFVE